MRGESLCYNYTMKIVVLMHNIRSTYNVGAILRTCDGFGITEVVLSGITPRVDDERILPYLREKLNKQIHKTALGAEKSVKIENVDDIKEKICELKEDGYKIIGLENNIENKTVLLDSEEMQGILNDNRDGKMAVLLGEEVDGIDKGLFPLVDYFVEIQMKGEKESFNVSVATGVILWEMAKKR